MDNSISDHLVIAVDMKLSMIIILITFVLMDFTDGQYPNCVKNCPDGEFLYYYTNSAFICCTYT